MRIATILLGVFFIMNSLKAEPVQSWEYQTEVLLPKTRSESISGYLLYKGVKVPGEFKNVITPVGEFYFDPRMGFGGKLIQWMPVTGSTSRKCVVPAEISEVSGEACLAGKFEERPKGAGADWFYVVKQGLWVNPQKMDEVLKTKLSQPETSPEQK